MNSSFRSKLILASKGVAMGIADIIPGVSGGTIAFISGIYEQLIAAISSVKPIHALSFIALIFGFWHKQFRDRWLKSLAEIHWGFLIPLGAGAVSAILVMSRIMPYLLEYYTFYMYSLFFGLILFSIPMVFSKVDRDRPSYIVLIVFAILMFLLMGAAKIQGSTALWYVFISGFIAISAMILPGISGSYILLLMGQYTLVLDALRTKDLIFLAVFISGIAVGILIFIRILKYLLHHYHSITMAALTGIMIGSLRVIWPGNVPPAEGITAIVIIMGLVIAALGGALIYGLDKLSHVVGDPTPPRD